MTRTIKACARIMAEAQRTGGITNKRASEVSGVKQPYHYLNTLHAEGLLRREARRWVLVQITSALAADYDRLLEELGSLSNSINRLRSGIDLRSTQQEVDGAIRSIQEEINMLIYSFDPDPPLNVRE